MTSYDHFIRLLVLIGFLIGGLLLTTLFSGLLMLASGMSLADIMEMAQSGMGALSPGLTRGLLATQHLLVFILPGLIFDIPPGWQLSILGIFFLMAAYPLVNLSFLVNESIPLPAWADKFESQA